MEKDDGVKKVAVPAPEEATPTLTETPPAPEKPETREKCYKKTVGEEATLLESAKDYFNQFKEMPAQKHWICLKSYVREKYLSVMSPAPTPSPLLDIPFGDARARFLLLGDFFWLDRRSSCLVVYYLLVLPAPCLVARNCLCACSCSSLYLVVGV